MSEREDFLWQRFFAACSFIFVFFTFTGLEVFWPQPPSFALSAEQTAAYYVEHRTGFLIGVVMCSIGMAFLLAWTVQFCLMLWRLEGGSRAVTAVTVASLAASQPRAKKFVAELWNTPTPDGLERYYEGLLYLMALLHCSGEFRVW